MFDTGQQDLVIGIHFTLKNAEGEELDSSEGEQPMHYLHGHHNIVPGLEDALTGAPLGSKHKIVVEAEQGYGERSTEPHAVPLDAFPADAQLEAGMQIATRTPEGQMIPLWIVDVTETEAFITIDHPFAGMQLHYDVEIVDIREATANELQQGSTGCSCC